MNGRAVAVSCSVMVSATSASSNDRADCVVYQYIHQHFIAVGLRQRRARLFPTSGQANRLYRDWIRGVTIFPFNFLD